MRLLNAQQTQQHLSLYLCIIQANGIFAGKFYKRYENFTKLFVHSKDLFVPSAKFWNVKCTTTDNQTVQRASVFISWCHWRTSRFVLGVSQAKQSLIICLFFYDEICTPLSICARCSLTLEQGSQTLGLRAACGPRVSFVRLAMLFGSFQIINIVVAKCLQKRFREIIESKLNDAQCGFRPGRSTADHI